MILLEGKCTVLDVKNVRCLSVSSTYPNVIHNINITRHSKSSVWFMLIMANLLTVKKENKFFGFYHYFSHQFRYLIKTFEERRNRCAKHSFDFYSILILFKITKRKPNDSFLFISFFIISCNDFWFLVRIFLYFSFLTFCRLQNATQPGRQVDKFTEEKKKSFFYRICSEKKKKLWKSLILWIPCCF